MVDIVSKHMEADLSFPRLSNRETVIDKEALMRSIKCCEYQAKSHRGYGGSREYLLPDTIDEVKEGYLVFDVGCGDASQLFGYSWLVGEEGEICCIDPSKELVEKARRNLDANSFRNVQIYEMDGANLEPLVLKYGQPNLILLFNVLAYVPEWYARKIVRACSSASAKGTKIICSTVSKEAHLKDAEICNNREKYDLISRGKLIYTYEDNGASYDAEGSVYSKEEFIELFTSNGFQIDNFISLGALDGVATEHYLKAIKVK